jgi:hypothetical protein
MLNRTSRATKTRAKNQARQTCFTPCTQAIWLLEPSIDAAEIAAKLATILLSTAGSSFDELQNARKCGQKLYCTVKSISWGENRVDPNRHGETTADWNQTLMNIGKQKFSFRGFLREKHETNNSITQTSLEKGRHQRQSTNE